jgi:hypothetical protein
MQHSGKCDCGCGEHSIWTIVRSDHGRKLWFLNLDHLRRWEADRDAQEKWQDNGSAAPQHNPPNRLTGHAVDTGQQFRPSSEPVN